MKTRLLSIWESLHTSYWFVPTLMVLFAIFLSFVTITIDQSYDDLGSISWIWEGGVDAARAVLSTIAGSVITVAGVTFSITITSLAFASSQFGPRLLRNFVSDTGNQVVLGTFLSTFVYCLLILRMVRSPEEIRFVPFLSVSVGLLTALASLAVLIYFIHHISHSIQAENLVARIGKELLASIENLFPEKVGLSDNEVPTSEAEKKVPKDLATNSHTFMAEHSGYIQAIANDSLLKFASEHDVIVKLLHRPGHFVSAGTPLALLWPKEKFSPEMNEKIEEIFIIGDHRTPTQDIEYSFNQLEEIALRALSPSTNDPFTAIGCMDWMGAALLQFTKRYVSSGYRFDEAGSLRIITSTPDFSGVAALVFNQVRQYGKGSPAVMIRCLDIIAGIAQEIYHEDDRAVLLHHTKKIYEDAIESTHNENDAKDIEERYQKVLKAIARQDDFPGYTPAYR